MAPITPERRLITRRGFTPERFRILFPLQGIPLGIRARALILSISKIVGTGRQIAIPVPRVLWLDNELNMARTQ